MHVDGMGQFYPLVRRLDLTMNCFMCFNWVALLEVKGSVWSTFLLYKTQITRGATNHLAMGHPMSKS